MALAAATALGLSMSILHAQGRSTTTRAQKFLGDDVRSWRDFGRVDAHWLNGSSRFWY